VVSPTSLYNVQAGEKGRSGGHSGAPIAHFLFNGAKNLRVDGIKPMFFFGGLGCKANIETPH